MTFKDKLLNYYNLTEEDYLTLSKEVDKSVLLDPNKISCLEKIKQRIFNAIKNNEKICIYGDYDCDGISATSIMVKTFEKLNYKVSYYIPNRYNDGYGLNVGNVIKLKNANFSLIITVDNGIAQLDAIDKANELGIDVIVVDHHEALEELPKAYEILHPIVSNISDIYASGGYMSLFLSAGLLGYYDDYLVTLAGLSVITDMMELKGYNRDVVRIAVQNLEKYQYKTLINLADSPIITEKTFGIEIGPKINAIGRLVDNNNIRFLVKYLTSEDEEEIFKICSWIKNNNEYRKTLTKEAVESLPNDFINDDGIVLKLEIKEGLLGLIANKLLNEYNVPVVVFCESEKDKGFLKGSIRSKNGFNVQKAFESLNEYLTAGGGHALAGGLTIKTSDFEDFKNAFINLCKLHKFCNQIEQKIDVSLQEISFENYKLYRTLAPFGNGFPEPVFAISDLPTKNLSFNYGGKNLSTQISMNSKLFGFNINESEVKKYNFIDVFGNFYLSSFRDKLTLELRITDFALKN